MSLVFDACPRCGKPVEAVRVTDIATFALPCVHEVTVTLWPERVELEDRAHEIPT